MQGVRLDWLAAETLSELPSVAARRAVQDLMNEVSGRPEWWPAPGGEEVADVFGATCWVSFVVYLDGIEVHDVGWLG